MPAQKSKKQSLKNVAREWGIDFQVFQVKSEMIDTLKAHCQKHRISQRELARRVPGLTQDRISKIFSGQVGHMTIDKLISILTVLNLKVEMAIRAA